MAKKPVADAAKAKADKQKKIVIALVCVLALAVAYAAKTMMGLNSGGGQKPQAVSSAALSASTTPAATTPVTTPSAAPAPPTLAGSGDTTGSSDTTTPVTSPTQLVAAVQPPADTGQLESFSRFATKDPFDSLGPKQGGGSTSGSGGSGGTTTTPATPPSPPTPPPTSAVISVNGVQESVSTGADFPASSSSPFFQLVSLTATTAQVAIAGGSFATGQATLTLHVNTPVTLVNTADGTRYTLLLLPQGAVAPGASSGSSSSPSTTTPATTTTTSTTPTTTTP